MSKRRSLRDTRMIQLLRNGKAAGMSRAEAWELIRKAVKENAAKDGWRDSETAMTLAEHQRSLEAVYGKEGE